MTDIPVTPQVYIKSDAAQLRVNAPDKLHALAVQLEYVLKSTGATAGFALDTLSVIPVSMEGEPALLITGVEGILENMIPEVDPTMLQYIRGAT